MSDLLRRNRDGWLIAASLLVSMILTDCTAASSPSVVFAPTVSVLQKTAIPATTVVPTRRPTTTPIPRTPTPTQVICDMEGLYTGVSVPQLRAIDLVNVSEECITRAKLIRSGVQVFGSWLPDGSGFVYRVGPATNTAVCVWSLAQQTTARCLIEHGDNYLIPFWSPGTTNYVAYYRWEAELEREFVTIAAAESGKTLYETDRSTLGNGIAERFLDWNPDGERVLLAVSDGLNHLVVVLDVATGTKRVLASFDAATDYLMRGVWVQGGANAALSVIDPSLCCDAEGVPEARDIYWVRGDGTGFKPLLKGYRISRFIAAPSRDRLLVDTYSSGSDISPMYWLDLQNGALTKALLDEFESLHPRLLGLTPDQRFIIASDGQYRTWLYDTETDEFAQLNITILGPIVWRPSQ